MPTPTPTLSDRKIEANRRNALNSTGPRTDAGKAKSSQNARKYGIFCKDLVVPGEDPAYLEGFKRDMLMAINPRTTVEVQFAEQIIADEWRIKRIRAAEKAMYERWHAAECERFADRLVQQRQEITQQLSDLEEDYSGEMDRLPPAVAGRMERLRHRLAQPPAPAHPPPPDAGIALTALMQNDPELERLTKYEQRLRNSVHRCFKQLRELRADEKDGDLSALTVCILSDEASEAEAEDEENEPTETASHGADEVCASHSATDVDEAETPDEVFSPIHRDLPPPRNEIPPPAPTDGA